MIEQFIEKEIERVVDPNYFPSSDDKNKITSNIMKLVNREINTKVNSIVHEKMLNMGFVFMEIPELDILKSGDIHCIYDVNAYINQINKNTYSLRVTADFEGEEIEIFALNKGDTFSGKNTRGFRSLLLEIMDRYKAKYKV